MRSILFLSVLFIVSVFINGCKEESSRIYIDVKNESQHNILISTNRKNVSGSLDSFLIKANTESTIINYVIWGCQNSGKKSDFDRDRFLQVFYDDSISILHYNSRYTEADNINGDLIAIRSLTEEEFWTACETDECAFVNTYTFTDADYQEAADKQ
ncbi:MAG: hypothetical protein ACPGEG_10120 [Salibacteraceae bacterium]